MPLFRAFLSLLVWWLASSQALAEDSGPRELRDWAAQADAVFRHFSAHEMRNATAIAQDGEGFIWIGTEGGLTRWDGYRTRIYHADPDDSGALPSNLIIALHADPGGRLWVGTAAGLVRYDPRLDRFIAYGSGPRGLGDASVASIADDGERGLWIGSVAGLDHLDTATGLVRKVQLPSAERNAVRAAVQTTDGGLWVGTQQGLYRRLALDGPFTAVPLPVSEHTPMTVTRLMRDSAGRVWIATRWHGAFVVDPGQSTPHAVHESGDESRLESEPVRSLVEAAPGQIWLGTVGGGGIVVVEPGAQWRTRRIRHHVEVATSLEEDDVSAMLRDRSGMVWVGTPLATNLHDPRQTGVSTLFGTITGDKPVMSLQVSSVLAAPGGSVWLGNGDGGGVELLDPVRGRVRALRPDPTQPLSALPQGRVISMARAAGGDLYFGTVKGLYRADAQGQHLLRVDVPGRPADAIVSALCADEGTLWLGGEDGLWGLDIRSSGATGAVRHEAAKSFASAPITVILRGAGTSLWVGTASGLNEFDIASATLRPLATDANDPAALRPGYVSSLLVDARGRLWIASAGVGLQIIERQGAGGPVQVRRLGLREGLPHTSVDKLLLDAKGNVWASTDNGLAAIDSSTFVVRPLGEAQGVAISAYWSNSGASTDTGDLVFGGMGGITVVHPAQLRAVATAPPVVVTEAHAGSRSWVAGSLNVAVPGGRLEIPADDHGMMIEFAALDFTAPELNHYSYRLRGFDSDWITTDASRRVARYTNLPPGDYTLQLRGSGHEATAPSTTLEVAVQVLPAWYQTTFFRLAVALAALLAVAATVQMRTAYLRRRQHELEELVTLRTSELVQRGEQLHASQQELQKIAYFDPLTGLANRRLFNEDLRHLIAQALRGIGQVTLVLIDLDHFKPINDTMGHDVGDALLVEVARRLLATVRSVDRVCRLGGDEFAVLLAARPDSHDAEAACRRIVQDLAMPFEHAQQTLKVTASVGAAGCPEHAGNPEALYKCADLALYESKKAGRNGWRWFGASPARAPEPDQMSDA